MSGCEAGRWRECKRIIAEVVILMLQSIFDCSDHVTVAVMSDLEFESHFRKRSVSQRFRILNFPLYVVYLC